MSYLLRAKKVQCTNTNYHATDGNIAAIDFGTTSLSLAYSTKGDPKINTLRLDNTNRRVANAVLIKKDGMQVLNIGDLAREQFSSMRSSEYPKYIYFERIKMLLRREKYTNRQSQVKAFTGEQLFLVEVIAFILKHVKSILIDHLSHMVTPLKTTDFDWVITVPAIWDARGKRMMREAAYLAGLLTESNGITQFTPVSDDMLPVPNEINPEKLTLALEPEAAAFYSQEMVGQQIDNARDQAVIERPSRYMVIDIGGGTVDITIHTESDNGDIIVECIPTGNDCGGTQVNEAFRKMLQEIVQDLDFSKFLADGKSKSRAILNKLLYNEFEGQKILFGNGHTNCEFAIDLPEKFIKHYDKIIEAEVNKIDGVDYEDDGTLYISENVMESKLFRKTLDGIISCTISAIEKNDCKVNTFYLVGGFGGCKFIHENIKNAIAQFLSPIQITPNVIVPESPELAVAQGAVIWRMKTMKVKARLSDATYGIIVHEPFDSKKHDEFYRYYDNEENVHKCDNVFEVFLENGELASVEEVLTTTVVPSQQSATKVNLKILSTPNTSVQYTIDKSGKPTVTEIGQLVIDVPNPDNLPRNQRDIDVTMDFSGTEIQAKAKYRVTGKEVKTVCDFLSA